MCVPGIRIRLHHPDSHQTQSECKSGTCLDPGMSGVCSSFGVSSGDSCFEDHQCFRDEQCCDGYVCDWAYCIIDEHAGGQPQFTSLDHSSMTNPSEYFVIYGNNFRAEMLFKLSVDLTCPADRSPVSNAPDGHYAARAMTMDSYGQSAEFNLKVYSTVNYGLLLLCYAVNDFGNYESTGLYIRVPKLVNANEPIQATVSWTSGFSKFCTFSSFSNFPVFHMMVCVL